MLLTTCNKLKYSLNFFLKSFFIIIVIDFITLTCFAQTQYDVKNWNQLGDSCFKKQNYTKAVYYFFKAYRITQGPIHLKILQTDGSFKDTINYNCDYAPICGYLAKTYAYMEIKDSAFYYLIKAVERDSIEEQRSNISLLTNCKIYSLFNKEKKFQQFNKIYFSEYLKYIYRENPKADTTLIIKIIEMDKNDQLLRMLMDCDYSAAISKDSLVKLQINNDLENQQKIIEIFEKNGYPGKSLVGSEYMDVGALIIQHSSLAIKRKFFLTIYNAAIKGELSYSLIPFLIDRILIEEGKKQLFGTQYNSKGLAPLENSENIPQVLKLEFGILNF